MKKILAILLSVMMIVSMAACDGAAAPVGGETESESETVSESQDVEPEITITPAAPVSSSEPESKEEEPVSSEESSEPESSEAPSEAESKPSEASSSQAPKSSASSSASSKASSVSSESKNESKSSASSKASSKSTPKEPEEDEVMDNDDLEGMDAVVAKAAELIVANINAERASLGIAKLTSKNAMMTYARVRAKECFTLFDHTRPNGNKFSKTGGYITKSYSVVGENIAMSIQLDESDVSARYLADDFTEQWIESPGHYANIKNARYIYTGVGVAYKKLSNGKWQFTAEQFFAGEVSGEGSGSGGASSVVEEEGGTGAMSPYSTTLTLDKTHVSIGVGETVVITPSTVKGSIGWNATMDPNGCASFSQPGGLKLGVTGLTPGTVTLTATYVDQTATCTIDIG